MEVTREQWEQLNDVQRAALTLMGVKITDKKKKAPVQKRGDYFARKCEEALKAKEYNLRVRVKCSLCKGEHDQYFEMRRSPNNANILESTRVYDPEWIPDKHQETYFRSCFMCKERLEKLGAAKLAILATRLSNHIVERDANYTMIKETL